MRNKKNYLSNVLTTPNLLSPLPFFILIIGAILQVEIMLVQSESKRSCIKESIQFVYFKYVIDIRI